ncbi:hypothetical protein LMG3410_01583 [Achromobacter aegrifaciens]|nr:hypothetical protein LMG3410_01583 [Achromobacter aegrifaciens]
MGRGGEIGYFKCAARGSVAKPPEFPSREDIDVESLSEEHCSTSNLNQLAIRHLNAGSTSQEVHGMFLPGDLW